MCVYVCGGGHSWTATGAHSKHAASCSELPRGKLQSLCTLNRTHLLHDAHELVAQHVARLHAGHRVQVQVQVGAGDISKDSSE